MSYQYTDQNQLDMPHTYMYADYGGADFLGAYVADRRTELARHLQGRIFPQTDELKAALATMARSLASARRPDSFSLAEAIPLQSLLAALLGVLAAGDYTVAEPWLLRIIQRFEVSKKLYTRYASGFRKGEGDVRNLGRYVELALCLALAYQLSGHLQYLSTQLKVIDLLLSLDTGMLHPVCSPEWLTLLVESELAAVCKLALSRGVTIDVA